jgi:anti-sigma factor RsiW
MTVMSCKRIRPHLSRYADAELSDREQGQVEQHIMQCPTCSAELDVYRALNQLLVAPEPIEASPYLLSRIQRQLSQSRRASRETIFVRLRPVLIPLTGAALVVLALVVSTQLSRTIITGSRDAAVNTINLPPEQSNVPAFSQEVAPESSETEDTLEFQQ